MAKLDVLWLRTALALVGLYVLLVPVGFLAAAAHRQALVAGASARALERVAGDARDLEAAVLLESSGLRSYVQTADPRLLGSYDVAHARAGSALQDLVLDVEGTPVAAGLGGLRTSADAWHAWSGQRRAQVDAGAPPSAVAGLGEGESLLNDVRTGAGRMAGMASTLAGRADADVERWWSRSAITGAIGPVGGSLLLLVTGSALLWLGLRPLTVLARAANRLAGGLEVDVPYTSRRDEVGAIAGALRRWRRAVASQRLIWQHSPVAMLVFGTDFAIRGVNPGQLAMFRSDPRRIMDRAFMTTAVLNATHPAYRKATTAMYGRLLQGATETEHMEKRYLRNDGAEFWGNCVVTLIRDAAGVPDHFVCMVEDISDRRERLERAARVQRDLLPEAPPELEGYELAGVCRPSREMGGDFFDWRRLEPGALTLTLGDVMGKDMPAALLMATVCAALRTSAAQRTVGEAVRSVAASTERDLERAGAFVTLFHGWLDLGTGTLSYVDAGHGLIAVLGEHGSARRAPRGRSLPLGVMAGERYEESVLRLEPGETLVVFSDGVLDVHPELEERLEAVGELLDGAATAREMAERLVVGPGTAADDLTAVVLRRHRLS